MRNLILAFTLVCCATFATLLGLAALAPAAEAAGPCDPRIQTC